MSRRDDEGVTWSVALALQEERDRAVKQLDEARFELAELRRSRRVLEATVSSLQLELDAAARPVEGTPAEAEARLASLRADLANVRRHAEQAVHKATAQERAERLRGLAEVADVVAQALDQSGDPHSPWHRGTELVLGRLRHQNEYGTTSATPWRWYRPNDSTPRFGRR